MICIFKIVKYNEEFDQEEHKMLKRIKNVLLDHDLKVFEQFSDKDMQEIKQVKILNYMKDE